MIIKIFLFNKSYYDKQTAFEFNLTAAGQKVDLMHLGKYGWDFNWDTVWDGKSYVGDSAWYAEMRVLFSQLRYAKNKLLVLRLI